MDYVRRKWLLSGRSKALIIPSRRWMSSIPVVMITHLVLGAKTMTISISHPLATMLKVTN